MQKKHKKPCKVIISEDALNDILALPSSLKKECSLLLHDLSGDQNLGLHLEDKNGRNLSSCYKLFFNNAHHRVVYRKQQIVKNAVPVYIAEVIAVGKRAEEQVYIDAANRIFPKKPEE